MTIIHSILIGVITITTTQTATAQNFYKWVDAKGFTHYTTTPSPKNAKKKGHVEIYGWRNSNPTNSVPVAQEATTVTLTATENQPIVHIPQIPQSATPAPPKPTVGTATTSFNNETRASPQLSDKP